MTPHNTRLEFTVWEATALTVEIRSSQQWQLYSMTRAGLFWVIWSWLSAAVKAKWKRWRQQKDDYQLSKWTKTSNKAMQIAESFFQKNYRNSEYWHVIFISLLSLQCTLPTQDIRCDDHKEQAGEKNAYYLLPSQHFIYHLWTFTYTYYNTIILNSTVWLHTLCFNVVQRVLKIKLPSITFYSWVDISTNSQQKHSGNHLFLALT